MAFCQQRVAAKLLPPNALPKVHKDQYDKLEEHFINCRNPTDTDIILVAAEVGLSENEVKAWFIHRLAIWRRQQGLPANCGYVND